MVSETAARFVQEYFNLAQLGFLILLGLAAYLFTRKESMKSGFRIRESDKKKMRRSPRFLRKKQERLALPGISLQGRPHEILGVSQRASLREIQKAYRELMKRYHPDKIGPEGQKIAVALTNARDDLLKKLKH